MTYIESSKSFECGKGRMIVKTYKEPGSVGGGSYELLGYESQDGRFTLYRMRELELVDTATENQTQMEQGPEVVVEQKVESEKEKERESNLEIA